MQNRRYQRDERILKAFKSAFFRTSVKNDTVDLTQLIQEAAFLFNIGAAEAWVYIRDLEREQFIEIEKPTCFKTRYAWMIAPMQLGSFYY